MAIFSKDGSKSGLSHSEYPNLANISMNASSVASKAIPSGQYHSGSEVGHHLRLVSPTAHAIQLYALFGSEITWNEPGRSLEKVLGRIASGLGSTCHVYSVIIMIISKIN